MSYPNLEAHCAAYGGADKRHMVINKLTNWTELKMRKDSDDPIAITDEALASERERTGGLGHQLIRWVIAKQL